MNHTIEFPWIHLLPNLPKRDASYTRQQNKEFVHIINAKLSTEHDVVKSHPSLSISKVPKCIVFALVDLCISTYILSSVSQICSIFQGKASSEPQLP